MKGVRDRSGCTLGRRPSGDGVLCRTDPEPLEFVALPARPRGELLRSMGCSRGSSPRARRNASHNASLPVTPRVSASICSSRLSGE